MAITVNTSDTFEQWRVKTNSIGQDLENLQSSFTSTTSDLDNDITNVAADLSSNVITLNASIVSNVNTINGSITSNVNTINSSLTLKANVESQLHSNIILRGNVINLGSYRGNVVLMPSTTEIDPRLGNYFYKSVGGSTTFSVRSASIPQNQLYAFTLELALSSGTVTWFNNIYWSEGVQPIIPTGKTSLFTFYTRDGGASWLGSYLLNFSL